MSAPAPDLSFGEFRLDPEQRLLLRGDTEVPITPKAYDLLAALLKRRGRVADHDRLMNEVWPDTVVEPGNLSKLVFQVRRVLGDAPNGRPWIETLPRRGYRLNVAAEEPAPAAAPIEEPAPEAGTLRVAVLAFTDLSPAGDEQAFCEGVAEEILLALVPLANLRVIARTSSFRFQGDEGDPSGVARRLGAGALVTGSVRKSADALRVAARLLDGNDGTVLWAEVFERPLDHEFEIQREIAAAVGRTLEARTPGAPASAGSADPGRDAEAAVAAPTRDMAAWEEYLRGRYLWNRRWTKPMREALGCFERAVARDPKFAAAWAGIADVYSTLGSWETGAMAHDEAQRLAREHALRALALDPELAEAHATLAYVALHYDRDFGDAAARFERALAHRPSYAAARHWRSHLLVAARRFDEALVEGRLALALDPMNLLLNVHMGWHWHMAREARTAIEVSERVVALDPSFHWGHFFLGLGAVGAGDVARAVDALRRAAETSGESPVMLGALGHAHAVAGDRREARAILRRLVKDSGTGELFAFERALIHGALAEPDEAFAALGAAEDHRSGWMAYLEVEPRLDPLRNDPRFEAFRRG